MKSPIRENGPGGGETRGRQLVWGKGCGCNAMYDYGADQP